jgi:hypothetical protein
VSSAEKNTENMKTGVISGAELMTPVFLFLVLCSTDDTSFYVFGILLHRWHQFSCSVEQSIENMKTGAIGGAEYLKHKNWCHQWSRVPKT